MCSVLTVLTLDLRQGLGANSTYRKVKTFESGSVCSVLTVRSLEKVALYKI